MRYDIVKKMLALIYRGIVDIPATEMQSFIRAAKYLRLHGFEKISSNLKVCDITGLRTERSGRGNYQITLKRIQTSTITTNQRCNLEVVTDSGTAVNPISDNGTAHSNDIDPNVQETQEFFPDLSEDSDEDDTMTPQLNAADETADKGEWTLVNMN